MLNISNLNCINTVSDIVFSVSDRPVDGVRFAG